MRIELGEDRSLTMRIFSLFFFNFCPQHGSVTQESADELRKELLLPLDIGTYAPWGAMGLGALMVLLSLSCFAVMQCNKKDSQSLNVNVRTIKPVYCGWGVKTSYLKI